jgi:peptidoglycan/LPS O-acetylase OafA/YrhL
MKIVRWIAAAALTLISLMDVGIALPGSTEPAAVRVLIPLLGLAGLAAVYGWLRRRPWGGPAALAAAAVNVAAAVIALAVGSDGALLGLVVSLAALALIAVVSHSARGARPQPRAAGLSR